MTRKPLSAEATAALQNAMRKACEWLEERNAERDADELARAMVRLADELGANV